MKNKTQKQIQSEETPVPIMKKYICKKHKIEMEQRSLANQPAIEIVCPKCEPTQPQEESWEKDFDKMFDGMILFELPECVNQVRGEVKKLGDVVEFYNGKYLPLEHFKLFIKNLITEIRKEERALLAEKVKVKLETYPWDMELGGGNLDMVMENRRRLNKFVLAELIKRYEKRKTKTTKQQKARGMGI